MKDSKFIELLNLYVDHQINPAEAEQLEAEVRSSPARLRVYREYCQMQKACTALAENFRQEAPASNPKVVEFNPRRSVGTLAYVGSLVAVAACVAVVFTVRVRQNERNTAFQPAAPMAVAAMAPSPIMTAIAARPALQPVFGPRLLTLREPNPEPAEVAATDRAAFGDWMNSVQLSSLPVASAEDLRFDTHASLQPDDRTYPARRPIQGKVEWTAFTFQK